eukprot:scaffold1839_cov382-Prasinococcus_capsulatus_cf.AAC.34
MQPAEVVQALYNVQRLALEQDRIEHLLPEVHRVHLTQQRPPCQCRHVHAPAQRRIVATRAAACGSKVTSALAVRGHVPRIMAAFGEQAPTPVTAPADSCRGAPARTAPAIPAETRRLAAVVPSRRPPNMQ